MTFSMRCVSSCCLKPSPTLQQLLFPQPLPVAFAPLPQGVKRTDSDVATAVRAIVVLAFAWLMAAITGQVGTLGPIGVMSWAFLVLSDVTTGASWICYYFASNRAS